MHTELQGTPIERLAQIREAKKTLQNNCINTSPSFSILVHGSSIYGYKEGSKDMGNYDDLDCLTVIPNQLSYQDFVSQIRTVSDDSSLPSEDIYTYSSNSNSMFRASAKVDGIEVGFHCIFVDNFKALTNVISANSTSNLLPSREKYANKIYGENQINGNGKHNFPADIVDKSEAYTTIKQFTYHPANLEHVPTLGVLADKWLTGEIIYSQDETLSKGLETLFRSFVRSSLFYWPEATDEDLVDLFHRSQRFDSEYRLKLKEKIQWEKLRLQTQLKKQSDDNVTPLLYLLGYQSIDSVPDNYLTQPTMPHNPNCHVSEDRVFKEKSSNLLWISRQHNFLKQQKVPLVKNVQYYVNKENIPVISQIKNPGPSLEKALVQAKNSEEVENLYKEVILRNIERIISRGNRDGDKLLFSFDPIPQNFVKSESGIFEYVDLDPVNVDFNPNDRKLSVTNLIYYSLFKTLRVIPNKYQELTRITIDFCKAHGIEIDPLEFLISSDFQSEKPKLRDLQDLFESSDRLLILLTFFLESNKDSINFPIEIEGNNLSNLKDLYQMLFYGEIRQNLGELSEVTSILFDPFL